MSRIIVKNLPKYIDEDRLNTIFNKFGEITDVKVIFRENRNRRFCFIGFKKEDAGVKAKDHFNNTYIDTCKIEVDIAKTADDPDLPRAWSQYAKNSSAYMNKNGIKPDSKQKQNDRSASTEINTEAQDKLKEDKKKKFLEFLQLMKTSKQTWNDDARRFDGTEEKKPENKKKNKKIRRMMIMKR